jgi:hypothetical protein
MFESVRMSPFSFSLIFFRNNKQKHYGAETYKHFLKSESILKNINIFNKMIELILATNSVKGHQFLAYMMLINSMAIHCLSLDKKGMLRQTNRSLQQLET